MGLEIVLTEDVCFIDLYQFRGQWFAGFAAIRVGGKTLKITDTLTVLTPEAGVYNNLPLPCLN